MARIFVNLKRFDVPRQLGGICPEDDSQSWIESIIRATVASGLGWKMGVDVAYFLPETLLIPAARTLGTFSEKERKGIYIGSQGVFRQDIQPGGNFGAFTANLPASAVIGTGATWSIIGHSEERKDKFELMAFYDPAVSTDQSAMERANTALNTILHNEVVCAFERGLNVLYCVGETAEERGDGSFAEQKPRIKEVLSQQLSLGLAGIEEYLNAGLELVIAYEPRWAIGPGKTPPGPEYIAFVSGFIKERVSSQLKINPEVLYGGGLKRENAGAIAGVDTIDGGLVALTKFTQPVAFDIDEFKAIIEMYLDGEQ